MKPYVKLAVFGGTFSPFHNGHLCALRAYAEAVRPDAVFVIPTALSPHKERVDIVSDAQRLEMLHLALDPLSFPCPVVVSDIEIVRGGKSYTIDTVTALEALAEEIVLYCGTDMLLALDQWREHERLLKMVTIAYMQRETDGRMASELSKMVKRLQGTYGARVIDLPAVPFEISSGEIRERIRRGDRIEELVPTPVAAYIERVGLYKEGSEFGT